MSRDVDVSKLSSVKKLSGSLNERVYHAIRKPILSMDFTPGEIVRKEAICKELGVSRSPVSEALRKLSDEGLVDVIPQSSTRVSKLSMTEIREGSFLREVLEVAAAARAAELRSDDQLSRLNRNFRMQTMLVEDQAFDEFYVCDEEFHDLIMECTGVSLLRTTVQMVSLQVQRARLLLLPEPGRSADTLTEHKRILDAIRDKSPRAAEDAMRGHLRQLISRLEPLEKSRPDLFIP